MGTTRVILEKDLIGGETTEHVYPVTSDYAVYNENNVNIPNYNPVINVNAFNKNATESYLSKQAARSDVNDAYRKNGMVITYNYNGVWITEQFIADPAVFDWIDDDYWRSFGSGGSSTLGTLNISNIAQQIPVTPESFENAITLHTISKTGKNTDLIDYVGKIRYNNSVKEGGIIFNDYVNNTAPGNNSSAFGSNTIANGLNQVVFGKYNVADNINKYAFIIGNGSNTTRQDILNVDWNGNIWGNTDVMCGGTFDNPQYRLSDLDNKLNIIDLDDEFVKTKSYGDIINTIIGSKYAYSFDTLEEMVTDSSKGLLNVDTEEYKQGGQLLMQQTGVSDYWITMIKDSYESYEWVDDETFEADVEENKMLQVGYYVVTKLETGSIDLTQYVKKSKLKTVNNIALFDDSAPDGQAGNIPFPTYTVSQIVEEDDTNAVSGDAVYNYVSEHALSTQSLKVLNTTNATSLETSNSETLYNGSTLNLHKISKTGNNTDLVNYVGSRVFYGGSDTHSEIFNNYTSNHSTGNYNHIGGSVNTATHNYCTVYGYGNTTGEDYQTIIGKFNDSENSNNKLFVIGGGTALTNPYNIFTVDKNGFVWSDGKISIGHVNSGIPDLQITEPNDLATKYYVDSKITTQLYTGVVNTNSNLLSSAQEGTATVVKTNTCKWINTDGIVEQEDIPNVLNIKIGTAWYGQYDILTFTDDVDNIENVNIIGGTKPINTSVSNYNIPIYLHNIAKTGSYNDLSDTPTIPTTTSQLTNNSGFITINDIPTNISTFNNDVGYITESDVSTVAISGDYNDLTNKPNLSALKKYLYVLTGSYVFESGTSKTREDIVGVSVNYNKTEIDSIDNQYFMMILKIRGSEENDFEDVYIRNIRTIDHGVPTEYEFLNTYSEEVTESNVTVTKHYINKISLNSNSVWSYSNTCISNDYNDLNNKPSIGSGTITIKQGNVVKGTFSVNQSTNTEITLGSGLQSVDWSDITNKPKLNIFVCTATLTFNKEVTNFDSSYEELETYFESGYSILLNLTLTGDVVLTYRGTFDPYNSTGVILFELMQPLTQYSVPGTPDYIKYSCVTLNSEDTIVYSEKDYANGFVINTNNTSSLSAAYEPVFTFVENTDAKEIKLHKISKTGSYNDLNNKPTNISSFTNDADYTTATTATTVENNTWTLNNSNSTFAILQLNQDTTLSIDISSNQRAVGFTSILRIDNVGTSDIVITLSKHTGTDFINCINNTIVIPVGNSCELSCFPTIETIESVNKNIANITIYNYLIKY